MYIETHGAPSGKEGCVESLPYGVVQWEPGGSFATIERRICEDGLRYLVFVDPEFFTDTESGLALCRAIRSADEGVLWSAVLDTVPPKSLLRAMRLAGCQRIEYRLSSAERDAGLAAAREYGLDVRFDAGSGPEGETGPTTYTVAEREAIAERLPGLHSAQFDLAVAYFKARRFHEVMLPLGKAMTLGFPMNSLCLNLLACLGAAKHYPEIAAGLLNLARHDCPLPVVLRNRDMLKTWLADKGDVRGERLLLDPGPTGPGESLRVG